MSFTVTRSEIHGEFQGQHTWPLQLVVQSTNGCAIPAEIFVFHAGSSEGVYQGDIFECVASVHQLQELGTDPEECTRNLPGVEENKQIPYYRRASLDFNCRSAEEAETLYQEILEDIYDLIRNFQAMQSLTTVDVTTLL